MTDSGILQRLVDDGRVDDLLREVTLGDVARTWMRYRHKAHVGPSRTHDDDPDWWAVEIWMDDRWWADERRVRDGILELIAAAESEDDCGSIGAGILEVFISADEDRLAWIETQAADSETFRRCLRNVYVWGLENDEVAQRVEVAAGTRLRRPTESLNPEHVAARLAAKEMLERAAELLERADQLLPPSPHA